MTDLNPHICSVLGPARRRLACVLIVGVLATLPSTAAAEMELPAPPTAAQAFTARQLLKWIGSLARHSPLTREVLAAKLPATFSPRQETRTRISWQAHLSRVSNWFAEVEFIDAGNDTICRLRFVPDNPITRVQAQEVLGNFEPLPPPSPPPLGPNQGPVSNPVFDRIYLRSRLADGQTLQLSFEPLERGGRIHEVTLTTPAPR
ncbi:MAG: hypothetical protein IPJ21_18660 [Sterolibacteriaceae bacterium]|nr:hypothetical protein [Sterolibacteriaceae bacterium]MBK9085763.1 hypothetical protein [Sterolibacteriaceae bacterium]